MIAFPLRTSPGMNVREHHAVRAKRVRSEKEAAFWALKTVQAPTPPVTVRLTRLAPSGGLDDDNLAGSMKAIRDAVAEWLKVDDRHRDQVRYVYAQKRTHKGAWGVGIEFGEPLKEAEFVPLKEKSC